MEPEADKDESILKPKRKRNLTDEQRQVLANRMREINDKRIADAMAKIAKKETAPEPVKEVPIPKEVAKEVPIPKEVAKETAKPKAKKVIRVIEIEESEDEESEEEEVVVAKKPAKKPAKKSEKKEDKVIQKPKKTVAKKEPEPSQPQPPQPPKVMFRFL